MRFGKTMESKSDAKNYFGSGEGRVSRMFILAVCTLSMLLLSGCIMIPVGCDTYSREVIGARADANGKVCEQIVHYNKRLFFIAIGITPRGLVASDYFGYSRYVAMTEKSEKGIWAMEHFPSLAWTRVNFAVPIPDSDRWITTEDKSETADEQDICLVVFSVRKGKIVRHRFKHALRYLPRDAKIVIGGCIEGNADLSILRVHEKDKITRVNTVTGEITTETDDSPPFSPVGIDWKGYETILKQPILRQSREFAPGY